MTLLREIQNAAIDSETNLATLLRKCKVLSFRLGSKDFKNWVDMELNGYDSIDELPAYRIFLNVHSKGHFTGPGGTGIKYADIPMISLPEKHRDRMSTCYITYPIASIASLIENSEEGTAREPWDPSFVAIYGNKIYNRLTCMQAWKVISITSLIALLDEVRNRILNFVLEIEAENPEAGEALIDSNPVSPEKVESIFNSNIQGYSIECLLFTYSNAFKSYKSALEKLEKRIYERNILDDLRLCLELLLKQILKNDKTLENQKELLGKFLKSKGASISLRNSFQSLLFHFTKYQNDYVKHSDKVNSDEIEWVKDQTESFIKHLILLENK